MSRFANLSDKPKASLKRLNRPAVDDAEGALPNSSSSPTTGTPASRVGRKAIAGYFSPEMSLAMHFCARKNGLNLQELMTEAFDEVLRKYGESPIGE